MSAGRSMEVDSIIIDTDFNSGLAESAAVGETGYMGIHVRTADVVLRQAVPAVICAGAAVGLVVCFEIEGRVIVHCYVRGYPGTECSAVNGRAGLQPRIENGQGFKALALFDDTSADIAGGDRERFMAMHPLNA